jgi:hypothetical protein
MKKLLLFIFLLLPLMASKSVTEPQIASKSVTEPIKDCKCKDIKLYGRVKIVDAAEDFCVKIVDGCEHLKVRKIKSTPLHCGQWEIVDACEDFRVKFVDGGEDFCIRFVDYDPY